MIYQSQLEIMKAIDHFLKGTIVSGNYENNDDKMQAFKY